MLIKNICKHILCLLHTLAIVEEYNSGNRVTNNDQIYNLANKYICIRNLNAAAIFFIMFITNKNFGLL